MPCKNLVYRIVEGSQRAFDCGLGVFERDAWVAIFLASVVEVHLRDLVPCALLNEPCVELELATVTLYAFPLSFKVWLAFRLEINQFHRVAFSLNQVHTTLDDIVWLDAADIHFRFTDGVPVSSLAFRIAQNLLQCHLTLCFDQIGVFRTDQRGIVGIEPATDVIGSHGIGLIAKHCTVDVLYGLVDKATEEHGTLTHRQELQFLVELVLEGAGLIDGDVGGEGECRLDLNVFHILEVEVTAIPAWTAYLWQRVIDLLEVEAWCPFVSVAGEHQQVLCTGEGRVVQPPEIKELDACLWLEGRTMAILGFKTGKQRIGLVAGDAAHRIHQHNGKLHSLGLMDGHKGDAATRRILRFILVFLKTAVQEATEEGVEKALRGLLNDFRCQNADIVKILELAKELREP